MAAPVWNGRYPVSTAIASGGDGGIVYPFGLGPSTEMSPNVEKVRWDFSLVLLCMSIT